MSEYDDDDRWEAMEAAEMAADRAAEERAGLDERIKTLEHELAKADRRTAEQERIITAQREQLERLRVALDDMIDLYDEKPGHAEWGGCLCPSSRHLGDCHLARIAEHRKLAEAP